MCVSVRLGIVNFSRLIRSATCREIVFSYLRGGVFLARFERLVFILIFSPRRSRGENRLMKTRSFRPSSKNSHYASTNYTFRTECAAPKAGRRENDESCPRNLLFEVGAVILKKGGGVKRSGAASKTPFSCMVALLMRCEKAFSWLPLFNIAAVLF
jgi:hypothetical protein